MKKINWKLKQKIVERFGTQYGFSLVIRQRESIISQVIRGRELSSEQRVEWARELGCSGEEIFAEN